MFRPWPFYLEWKFRTTLYISFATQQLIQSWFNAYSRIIELLRLEKSSEIVESNLPFHLQDKPGLFSGFLV